MLIANQPITISLFSGIDNSICIGHNTSLPEINKDYQVDLKAD